MSGYTLTSLCGCTTLVPLLAGKIYIKKSILIHVICTRKKSMFSLLFTPVPLFFPTSHRRFVFHRCFVFRRHPLLASLNTTIVSLSSYLRPTPSATQHSTSTTTVVAFTPSTTLLVHHPQIAPPSPLPS